MSRVWQELRRFLKRSYTNQRTARKFELRRRIEQVLLTSRQIEETIQL